MLARILIQRTEWERALQEIEVLVKQYPGDPDYLNLKAHALLHSGEYEGAISCFEALVSDHSTAEHWMFYGYALATVGRYPESIAAYRKAIALKPDLSEVYWEPVNLKTFRFTSQEIDAMRKMLERPNLDPRKPLADLLRAGQSPRRHGSVPGLFRAIQKRQRPGPRAIEA